MKNIVKKWNFRTRQYEDYNLPDGSCAYNNDMDALVVCANCGGFTTFGKAYTSKRIHSELGFGYAVCENCYSEEVEVELKFNKSRERGI